MIQNTETSLEAKDSIKAVASNLRESIYQYLLSCENGSTDDAGEEALGMKHTTYTARRGELYKKGFVINSGVKSKTRSNRNAWVWVAVPREKAVPPTSTSTSTSTSTPTSLPKIDPKEIPFPYDLSLAQKKLVEKLKTKDSCRCPCCGVEVTK